MVPVCPPLCSLILLSGPVDLQQPQHDPGNVALVPLVSPIDPESATDLRVRQALLGGAAEYFVDCNLQIGECALRELVWANCLHGSPCGRCRRYCGPFI